MFIWEIADADRAPSRPRHDCGSISSSLPFRCLVGWFSRAPCESAAKRIPDAGPVMTLVLRFLAGLWNHHLCTSSPSPQHNTRTPQQPPPFYSTHWNHNSVLPNTPTQTPSCCTQQTQTSCCTQQTVEISSAQHSTSRFYQNTLQVRFTQHTSRFYQTYKSVLSKTYYKSVLPNYDTSRFYPKHTTSPFHQHTPQVVPTQHTVQVGSTLHTPPQQQSVLPNYTQTPQQQSVLPNNNTHTVYKSLGRSTQQYIHTHTHNNRYYPTTTHTHTHRLQVTRPFYPTVHTHTLTHHIIQTRTQTTTRTPKQTIFPKQIQYTCFPHVLFFLSVSVRK